MEKYSYMEHKEINIDEQIKKLSPAEIKEYAAQLMIQKERAKQRSKANVQKKKEKGIKPITIDIPEQMLDKFRILMERTSTNKTILMCNMISLYEQVLDQEQQQEQQTQRQQQQNNQQHNQQQHNRK